MLASGRQAAYPLSAGSAGQEARVVITGISPFQKTVAARGLTVPIERGPDNRAFIGQASPADYAVWLPPEGCNQSRSTNFSLSILELNDNLKFLGLRAPAGVQSSYTAGQVLKTNIGKTCLCHHGRERFLIRKPS